MPAKTRPNDVDPYAAACEYWLREPKNRIWKRVAKEMELQGENKAHQNYLARLVRRYEEEGFVKHIVLAAPRAGSELLYRMPETERELVRWFPLRGAAVVDLALLRHAPQFKGHPTGVYEPFDYELHKSLARTASDVLLSLVRKNDVIGVGGGRAIYRTAESLLPMPEGRNLVSKVISLTGQLSTQLKVNVESDGDFSFNTDADQVAQLIAAKLRVKATVKVNRSLASQRFPPLLSKMLREVTLAMVGVGVLTEKHPLGRWNDCEDLTRVAKQLAQLWETCKRLDVGTQHLCADISNHLFIPTESSRHWERISDRDRTLLENQVAEVNKHTVTAKVEHFQSIAQRGSVILVAGGEHKHGAIYHILCQGFEPKPRPWITHLVTDDVTANWLLSKIREKSRNMLPSSTREP